VLSCRRRLALTVISLLLVALAVPGLTTTTTAAGAPSGTLRYAVNRPACTAPTHPGEFRCFAIERVEVRAGTRGAYAYDPDATFGHGHIGGYSPNDLAQAYGYSAGAAVSETVAIVDWYDDPQVRHDLNVFDHAYGLPRETPTSFRTVNQNGQAAPLPVASTDTSTEISLDVQAVRAVCHRCRIVLVEAFNAITPDITAAENTAARLHANEISNSFGTPESSATSSALRAAFKHPGTVITASTGDDGWYDWDFWNAHFATGNEPQFPSTSANVVAVGGTLLKVTSTGARASETVWNENGADDNRGIRTDRALGAGGGGCSTSFSAKSWQSHVAGYRATGCGSGRLAADVSAIADPQRGFDVFDSYGHGGNAHQGWLTVGGTSLSAPVTAALFALAGGSGGSAWPAASLYINSALHPTRLFDVTSGGTGFCGGAITSDCMDQALTQSQGATNNPNDLTTGSLLDCSFPASGFLAAAPPRSSECDAVTGYDGPSGVGAPHGLGLFHPTSPSASIVRPTVITHRVSAAFTAHVIESIADAHPTTYAWKWGDGTTAASTTATAQHTYHAAGRYTITLTVSDSLHQVVIRTKAVTVD
jgi:hypothetical protein